MLTDKHPRDSYTDLLDERADAALISDLDRLHRPPPPPNLRPAIARAIEQRAAARRAQTPVARPWWRPFPTSRRVGVALVALLAFTMLAAAAVPLVTSIVDKAFGMHPGTNPIVSRDLGKELGLAQTINGFTVTIERAYADANQIVIGYSVSGPPGRSFNNFGTHDSQGRRLPTLIDASGQEFRHAPFGWGAGVEAGKGGYLKLYDGSTIAGNPDELQLRLTIPVIEAIERGTSATPTEASDGSCTQEICFYTVEGPFVFDFSVPFERGRVVEPNQTVEIGGVSITLDRVASTPTGTRVTLRGTDGSRAKVTLTGGGKTYSLDFVAALIRTNRMPQPPLAYETTELLDSHHQEWTLTVTTEQGTATFHFTLP